MSLEATFLAWTALALITTLTPGPDTLLVIGHSAQGGVRAGLAAVAGIVTGGLWYMALLGLGLMGLLAASPILFSVVKAVGAVYLAYLGVRLLMKAAKDDLGGERRTATLQAPFRQGLLTNALNPKVALFYLAALPQFVGTGPDAPYFGMLLIGIHYLIGAAWLSALALGAARAGSAMRRSGWMRWLEAVLGTLFVGLAGRLALVRNG